MGQFASTTPPNWVRDLCQAPAYGGDDSARSGVEHRQTHISHVFLTRDRVYKVRKSVDLGFLDFSTRAARNRDCQQEVDLNRRLAPSVYLGIAPIRSKRGRAFVGEPMDRVDPRDPHEHCVVMRRLPDGRDALSLLGNQALQPEQLERVAARIAVFHSSERLGTPAPFSATSWLHRIAKPIEDNFAALGSSPRTSLAQPVRRAQESARGFLEAHRGRFEARRLRGRAVDGHGDLHLDHIWFERDDAAPTIIDCLEFNDDLRRIDAASEVAFLAMDLAYRSAPALAEHFLRCYARDSDDYDLYGVVDFFQSYRACVRAKVAAIAAEDPEISPEQREQAVSSAERHLDLAIRALTPRPIGAMILMSGSVGSGKSTVANALAYRIGGVVLSTDHVRKHLFDVAPVDRRPAVGAALYTEARIAQVYDAILARAGAVLESGRSAVLDATYSRRSHRAAARDWAASRGIPVFCVESTCPKEIALARLAKRKAEGADASDAGPERYEASVAAYEAPSEWPAHAHTRIDTTQPGWEEALATFATRIPYSV